MSALALTYKANKEQTFQLERDREVEQKDANWLTHGLEKRGHTRTFLGHMYTSYNCSPNWSPCETADYVEPALSNTAYNFHHRVLNQSDIQDIELYRNRGFEKA